MASTTNQLMVRVFLYLKKCPELVDERICILPAFHFHKKRYKVRRRSYRMHPRNITIINNGWANVENGTYNLQDFIRNVSYTSEQLLRNEIGEPDFQPMLAIQGLNPLPLDQLPQRPPQLLLRPLPVPQIIRPAVQPPIVEEVPVAIQPAETVQQPMVEVPAVALQNARDQRGLRRRGRLNARVRWAEFIANIEEVILEVCVICYEEVVTVTIVPCRHTFCNTCITRFIDDLIHVHYVEEILKFMRDMYDTVL